MSRDRYERKHRRTWRHPESIALMADADFGAAPSLSEAMGLNSEAPMTTATLRSTQDTTRIRTLVMRAARAHFVKGLEFTPAFEHGHWWLTVDNPRPDADWAVKTFSVVDAMPGIDGTGLDFEEV